MKILVTGGLGFIGSHLSESLVEDGHNVFIYDNKVNRKVTTIARAEVVSYRDYRWHSWDVIVHLAAKGVVVAGCDVELIDSNIAFGREMLSTPYRTVYASSAAVRWPMTQYSWSKIYNEEIASRHPNATGLRFQNVYGPRDNGVIGKMLKACISGETFMVNGGNQQRDYIWVGDIVKVIKENLTKGEKIVEVGTGVVYSINEIIPIVERICGKTMNHEYTQLPAHESKYSICEKPLKSFVGLEDGINRYFRYLTI